MRIQQILFVLASIPAIAAPGEYAHWHFGGFLGLGCSPSKEYRQFGVTMPNGETVIADGAGLLAPMVGLGATFSFHPSRFRLGLDLDVIRTIGKSGGSPSYSAYDANGTRIGGGSEGVSIKQTGVRGTIKMIISGRPNTYQGSYFWLGPSWTRSQTELIGTSLKSDYAARKDTLAGGGAGIGYRKLGETSMGIYEFNLHYQKKSDAGIKAGGLTIEIRFGSMF